MKNIKIILLSLIMLSGSLVINATTIPSLSGNNTNLEKKDRLVFGDNKQFVINNKTDLHGLFSTEPMNYKVSSKTSLKWQINDYCKLSLPVTFKKKRNDDIEIKFSPQIKWDMKWDDNTTSIAVGYKIDDAICNDDLNIYETRFHSSDMLSLGSEDDSCDSKPKTLKENIKVIFSNISKYLDIAASFSTKVSTAVLKLKCGNCINPTALSLAAHNDNHLKTVKFDLAFSKEYLAHKFLVGFSNRTDHTVNLGYSYTQGRMTGYINYFVLNKKSAEYAVVLGAKYKLREELTTYIEIGINNNSKTKYNFIGMGMKFSI